MMNMALQKTNYIDDQTVISAKNLNDIQDAIVALEARKVNGKPLSSDVSLSAGDVGAAPAGYGLGGWATAVTDINDAVDTGWYATASTGTANKPFGYSAVQTIKRNNEQIIQIGYDVSQSVSSLHENGAMAIRRCDTGTWTPWEAINPPMYLGVEYRTTERWNGKAVYAKLIDFGEIPNTANASKKKSNLFAEGVIAEFVRAEWSYTHSSGQSYIGSIPEFAHAIASTVGGGELTLIRNGTEISGVTWTAKVALYYTKN